MRIRKGELERGYRQFVQRAASCLIAAVAERGMTFEEIGSRLGVKGKTVRQLVHSLIEGKTTRDGHELSDLARALDCRLEFRFEELPEKLPASNE